MARRMYVVVKLLKHDEVNVNHQDTHGATALF